MRRLGEKRGSHVMTTVGVVCIVMAIRGGERVM